MIEQVEKSTVKITSATYFILPMLQLNKSSFGVGNFVNSYVDKNGYVIVDVVSIENVPNAILISHPQYVTDFDTSTGVRLVYQISDEYMNDISVFEQGKYSQLSPDLKVAISKYSGLKTTDFVIKSLNPQKEDRQAIADKLGVRVDIVKELLSAPSEREFIKIK